MEVIRITRGTIHYMFIYQVLNLYDLFQYEIRILYLKFMKVTIVLWIRKKVECTTVRWYGGPPENCRGSGAPVQRTGGTGGSYGPVEKTFRYFLTCWHHANTANINSSVLSKPRKYANKITFKVSILQAEIEYSMFDAMTWRHDVTSLCKYKTNMHFKLSKLKCHRNKTESYF